MSLTIFMIFVLHSIYNCKYTNKYTILFLYAAKTLQLTMHKKLYDALRIRLGCFVVE
jgi:hypothetical protein